MSQPSRSLLVVGSFRNETLRRVEEAAAAAGAPTQMVSRCDEARGPVADGQHGAILLRMDAPGAAGLCAQVRTHSRLADVPIFGVSSERPDLAFTELFSWGADDLVSLWSPHPLARRLRPLIGRPSLEARGPGQGSAIVAGADPQWRSIMARALYHGGFSVRFASGSEALAAEASNPSVKLVVACDDLSAEGPAAIVGLARREGAEVACVVVAPPKRMAAAHADVGGLPRVAVADGYAPPENVLFLANELLARRGVDQRASARLLYGTAVHFRAAGRDEDEVGFSYNVSASGLYVRTLAPLDAGKDVWLEMWPPRSERRVRLSGVVAWRRPFGAAERATVPAGFGVKITGGLPGDLDRWCEGYQTFAESMLGARAPAPSVPET